MSVLVCHRPSGGCGYVGFGHEWKMAGRDLILCPVPACGEDHAYQVTRQNINYLFEGDEEGKARAVELLTQSEAQ